MAADLELLRRYADTRDASVFADLTSTYADMVFGTCLRILSDRAEAEDAAQECFWRLARESASIRISVGAWLHRCATNEAITRKRRRTSRLQRERAHETERQARQEESSEWVAVSGAVDQALDTLPADLRDLLVAHFLQRKTQADLARDLNISPATMSRRIAEGIDLLRRQMRRLGVVASVALIAGLLTRTATAAPLSRSLIAGLGKIALAGPVPRIPWWGHPGLRLALGGTAATAAVIVLWAILHHRQPAAPQEPTPVTAIAHAGYAPLPLATNAAAAPGPRESLLELAALGFPTGPQVILSGPREAALPPSLCWDDRPYLSLGSGQLLQHNQNGPNDLGADLEAVPGSHPQLRGIGSATWRVDNARFETLQVEAHLNQRLDVGVDDPQPLDATLDGTQTYLFITRQKQRGILQCSTADGKVQVRWRLFSGPGLAAPPAAPSSAIITSPRRFTEVRDAALADGAADAVSALDLDTNNARPDPTRAMQRTAGSVKWLRSWGGDVSTVAGEHLGLTLDQGICLPVSDTAWDQLTATQIPEFLARHSPADQTTAVIDPAPPPGSGIAHTWLFATREGGQGILQIQGGGLTPTQPLQIRYKLAVKD